MNDLKIINRNGQLLIESREVAGMTGKRHDHLLRDIDGYVAALSKSTAPNFGVSDFFIESTYEDSTKRVLKCYLLTRKGCDMVANKMTGEKGVLFTAAYVTQFEEMEKQLLLMSTPSYMFDDPIQRAERWITEQKERQVLQLQNAQKDQIINELQPKATYYDLVLHTKSVVSISQIAKDYGLSGTALNKMLHELGVQYKQTGCWLLYQKYADKGYTQSKTQVIDSEKSVMHTYWTQKGRLFLYDLLKNKKGLLPLMERDAVRCS